MTLCGYSMVYIDIINYPLVFLSIHFPLYIVNLCVYIFFLVYHWDKLLEVRLHNQKAHALYDVTTYG